jgi:hypothetical protein
MSICRTEMAARYDSTLSQRRPCRHRRSTSEPLTFTDDERHSVNHQATDEVYIAREPIQLGYTD